MTPLFVITAYVQAAPAQRWLLVKRTVLLAFSILVIAGPLALAMYQAGQDPRIVASTRLESYAFRPDVLEFIVPPTHSRLWGSWSTDFLARFGILSNLETNVVFLSWVGLFLVGLAWLKQRRAVAVWVGVTVVTAVLALGPSLQLLGQDTFTAFDLPLIMPFAFVSELPGLGVIRTPGRFMMVGSVTFIVAASYGLAWLTNRFSQQSHLIIAVALALLLLENWPHAWSQETLRPIPDFYQQIAADPEQYGVLDLPIKPSPLYNHISYSAHYQMYQTIHGQGIATAYISRSYTEHPLFPCLIPDFGATSYILFVNGEPSKCYANILDDLNRANYRYIVWHKPQNHYPEYRPGSWGEEAAAHFINQTLGGQPPLLEDELVRVYHIPGVATEDLTLAMNLGDNWYPFQPEYGYRWAVSPAVIRLASPVTQPVVLEIMPGAIYAPETDGLLGDAGQLVLKMDNGFETTVSIRRDEVTAVPLTLPAGQRTLTLTLTAGNFRSSDYGTGGERQQLSFAIRSINLQTVE